MPLDSHEPGAADGTWSWLTRAITSVVPVAMS